VQISHQSGPLRQLSLTQNQLSNARLTILLPFLRSTPLTTHLSRVERPLRGCEREGNRNGGKSDSISGPTKKQSGALFTHKGHAIW
jgi:hypothetical protein